MPTKKKASKNPVAEDIAVTIRKRVEGMSDAFYAYKITEYSDGSFTCERVAEETNLGSIIHERFKLYVVQNIFK